MTISGRDVGRGRSLVEWSMLGLSLIPTNSATACEPGTSSGVGQNGCVPFACANEHNTTASSNAEATARQMPVKSPFMTVWRILPATYTSGIVQSGSQTSEILMNFGRIEKVCEQVKFFGTTGVSLKYAPAIPTHSILHTFAFRTRRRVDPLRLRYHNGRCAEKAVGNRADRP